MTDLSQFDTREKADAGVDVPLVINGQFVKGDDKERVTFRIRGQHCDEVAKVTQETLRRPGKTPADVLENDMRLAEVAVIGWSDNFCLNGEKYEFSKDNIRKVMAPPLVREAILNQIYVVRNFMNGA